MTEVESLTVVSHPHVLVGCDLPDLTIDQIAERANTSGILDEILRRTGPHPRTAPAEEPEVIAAHARLNSVRRLIARVEDEDAEF
jgi:hypothetical protein